MGILEKISEIEKEIARTQKNKATEYHLGLLKAKLAKYRAQLLEPSKSASSKGEGFDVMKSGDARVALIGFPSVGKSTFLSLMTSTASEAASYEFTTLTCIPGVIEYKGANIQLLDLPGIIEGAAQGKGRGRQVIAVARTADVVIMMLDATKGEVQRSLLEKELESVGIRLNKHKPNIYFKPKKGGGISFNSTVTLTQCSEKLVQLILHEYKIFNAEVLFREDCSPDEFIDVIVGNRVYMPCLYVYNKIDQISMEEVDRLARKPNSVVISCGMKLNLDYLLEMLWEYLALTCIYTKKRGQRPDFTDAIILRKGASVEHVVPESATFPSVSRKCSCRPGAGLRPRDSGLRRWVSHQGLEDLWACGKRSHIAQLQSPLPTALHCATVSVTTRGPHSRGNCWMPPPGSPSSFM
uniref:Developmentally regulated GTP binding protein 2 n=1 Tax=Macaca fascicularis TaxID=9541 RepID=A0A7N9CXI8_MACFA